MSVHVSRSSVLLLLSLLAAALGVAAAGCRTAQEIVPEVVVVARGALPADPADGAWGDVPVHVAPLLLQDLVEPRLLEASTPTVKVQAVTDGARIAMRLVWDDPTKDDLPGDVRFSDACAVQLPAKIAADLPAPQMGEPGRLVEISYWRAFWQATVDGRGDTIKDIHPGAADGHYPFDAASLPPGSDAQRAMELRYAPARGLENRMGGPRASPVEDLVADGPGTLRPAGRSVSEGRGVRTAAGWAVVLARPSPAGLAASGRTQVAFAIWQGAKSEVGSRKMRSAWIPMSVRRTAP